MFTITLFLCLHALYVESVSHLLTKKQKIDSVLKTRFTTGELFITFSTVHSD